MSNIFYKILHIRHQWWLTTGQCMYNLTHLSLGRLELAPLPFDMLSLAPWVIIFALWLELFGVTSKESKSRLWDFLWFIFEFSFTEESDVEGIGLFPPGIDDGVLPKFPLCRLFALLLGDVDWCPLCCDVLSKTISKI